MTQTVQYSRHRLVIRKEKTPCQRFRAGGRSVQTPS